MSPESEPSKDRSIVFKRVLGRLAFGAALTAAMYSAAPAHGGYEMAKDTRPAAVAMDTAHQMNGGNLAASHEAYASTVSAHLSANEHHTVESEQEELHVLENEEGIDAARDDGVDTGYSVYQQDRRDLQPAAPL